MTSTSSLPAYQAIASRHGTAIVAASEGFALKIGGGITKHPFVLGIASTLRDELRAAGAEAKLTAPCDDGRVFVYLSGCSFADALIPKGSPPENIQRQPVITGSGRARPAPTASALRQCVCRALDCLAGDIGEWARTDSRAMLSHCIGAAIAEFHPVDERAVAALVIQEVTARIKANAERAS